jgi:23S rRNA (cytosine1962-C5)-methyltransferase
MTNLPVPSLPATPLPTIRVQAGRHKRAFFGHPWLYSNEVHIDNSTKKIAPGTIVRVLMEDGTPMGLASFNPHTLIAARFFSRDVSQTLDADFLATILRRALQLRGRLSADPFYRLIHAEADGMPGVIVDRFGDKLVVQLNTAGAEKIWPQLQAAIDTVLAPKTVVVRRDSGMRVLEGLSVDEAPVVIGAAPASCPVIENGCTYFADLVQGQKTGWYFDQRDNHARIAALAKGGTVLDLYTHTGGFALQAAKAGAVKVTGVDSSAPALALAAEGAAASGVAAVTDFVAADVFEYLEALSGKSGNQAFDIVIADPPAFVKSKKDVEAGSKGYRKLARLAAPFVKKGGIFFIASCSHNMDVERFGQEVAKGLQDAGRTGRILYSSGASADHPVHPQLPESAYLKALTLQLD